MRLLGAILVPVVAVGSVYVMALVTDGVGQVIAVTTLALAAIVFWQALALKHGSTAWEPIAKDAVTQVQVLQLYAMEMSQFSSMCLGELQRFDGPSATIMVGRLNDINAKYAELS